MKICLVAGARPNIMKLAPLVRAAETLGLDYYTVYTNQHRDANMSDAIWKELGIDKPTIVLYPGGVGIGPHAKLTSEIMIGFEDILRRVPTDFVIVVGDVDSTLACTIAAKKMGVKVAHVEAGLRSGDMSMPEEINRIMVDSVADMLFVTEMSGILNLNKEGKYGTYYVGNVMADNLYHQLDIIEEEPLIDTELSVEYCFLTMHRPENVDNSKKLISLIHTLNEVAEKLPVVFPVHPRTAKRVEKCGGWRLFSKKVFTLLPLSFRQSLRYWMHARFVVTDSGGLQEETSMLGIPCITIRENTERPSTVEYGTNIVVGTKNENIIAAVDHILSTKPTPYKRSTIKMLDGKAALRIMKYFKKGE